MTFRNSSAGMEFRVRAIGTVNLSNESSTDLLLKGVCPSIWKRPDLLVSKWSWQIWQGELIRGLFSLIKQLTAQDPVAWHPPRLWQWLPQRASEGEKLIGQDPWDATERESGDEWESAEEHWPASFGPGLPQPGPWWPRLTVPGKEEPHLSS